MKFNWGHGITIFFSGFVVFILFMAYMAFQEDHQLVAEDYYEQEIAYQGRINKESNALTLKELPSINSSTEQIELRFPASIITGDISGDISFFRPSEKALDFTERISLNEEGIQQFSREKFKNGRYQAKISWSSGDKEFYKEYVVIID